MAQDQDTAALLRCLDPLRGPAKVRALEALRFPGGSSGLDAGCGIGSHLSLLAQAVEPGGRITGLDRSGEHLRLAREAVRQSGLANRISFRQGDVSALPFESRTFHWAWSADCVGLIPEDPESLLRELSRVVKPGGTVALLLWSSQQLLPGYPALEARLNGTSSGLAPATEGWPPERHLLRALGWLRRAGFQDPAARTFAVDIHAPLDEKTKTALTSILKMRWGRSEEELPAEDRRTFRRLVDRAHPESILDREDYFGFFTYSLFWGRVPEVSL